MSSQHAHFQRVYKLLHRMDWIDRGDDGDFTSYSSRQVESLFELLDLCDDTEQDLLFNLLDRFLRVRQHRYGELIKNASRSMPESWWVGCTETIVVSANLLEKKVKSGSYVGYPMQDPSLDLPFPSASGQYTVLASVEDLARYRARKNTFILFVDDYSGTGDTVCKALSHYQTIANDCDSVAIMVLVAHETALARVKAMGLNIACAISRKRGISDFYQGLKLDQTLDAMRRLESKLGVSEKYSFGYGKTEGLEQMVRTPNNTFPVFLAKIWLDCA